MRPYRGLTKEGKWVYGWYFEPYNAGWKSYIAMGHLEGGKSTYTLTEVISKTIGQFVTIINLQKIWEGDLLTGHCLPKREPFLVKWDEGSSGFSLPYSYNAKDIKVAGNIHQKLLEKDNA